MARTLEHSRGIFAALELLPGSDAPVFSPVVQLCLSYKSWHVVSKKCGPIWVNRPASKETSYAGLWLNVPVTNEPGRYTTSATRSSANTATMSFAK